MPQSNPRANIVVLDLCDRDCLLVIRLLEGRRLAPREGTTDLIADILRLETEGYTEVTQHGNVFVFERPIGTD